MYFFHHQGLLGPHVHQELIMYYMHHQGPHGHQGHDHQYPTCDHQFSILRAVPATPDCAGANLGLHLEIILSRQQHHVVIVVIIIILIISVI